MWESVGAVLDERRAHQPGLSFRDPSLSCTRTRAKCLSSRAWRSMVALSTEQFLVQLLADVDISRDVALANPIAAVPSTPEWNALSLFGHIAQNLAYAAWVLTETPRLESSIAHPPLRDDFASWLDEFQAWASVGVDRFVTAVYAAKGRSDVTNWTGANTTPDFWARRMCHETAIHRWDLENAAGATTPLPPEIAVDALAELTDVLIPHWMQPRRPDLSVPPLRLRAVDIPIEVTIGPTEQTAGDISELSATASELVLILLGRLEPTTADHDAGAVVAWRRLCRFADA